MAKVLVTGIAGFTGRYVVRELAARGHDIIGIVREGYEAEEMETGVGYSADLSDLSALQRVIAETQPERVVHLAAISSVVHADVNAFYETNLIGTLNLLNALTSHARHVDRVLVASSANVYGNQQGGQLDERTAARPSNHYGASKLAMEHMVQVMAGRLPIIVTRPFNYTGVGQSPTFVVPKIVDHARKGQADLELGNIDVARDFSDVRGVANIYARLLDCADAVGRTFNVCSGRPYALREIIAMIENLADIKFNISVNPAFVRSDEIVELFGNPGLLEGMIGPTDMPAMSDTLSWMLEH